MDLSLNRNLRTITPQKGLMTCSDIKALTVKPDLEFDLQSLHGSKRQLKN